MPRIAIVATISTLLALSACAGPGATGGGAYQGTRLSGAVGPSGEAPSTSRGAGAAWSGASHRTSSRPSGVPAVSHPVGGGRPPATLPPPAPGAPTRHRAPLERRQYRPGLATVFGERVSSRVSTTTFERASSRPVGLVSIHYNDYRGLWAMTRHLRRRCCGVLPPYSVRGSITVQLVDARGRPLRGVQIAGKTIVMGSAGARYGILVRNLSPRRFEVVASVDGLDVIDGRRASLTKRGYVLSPYDKVLIRGFRTSRLAVAAFRFGSVASSYAARTGDARNVGVVGVAVFSELRRPAYSLEALRRLRARPFAQPPGGATRP